MSKINLNNEDYAPLIEDLQVRLDAKSGEYDKYIKLALKRAFAYCRSVAPTGLGSLYEQKLPIDPANQWVDCAIYRAQNIKKVQLFFANANNEHGINEPLNPICELEQITLNEFLSKKASLGRPLFYSILNGKIGVLPKPNMSYEIVISYIGLKDKEFLDIAGNLILARACYEIHRDITLDKGLAQIANEAYNQEYLALADQISKENANGKIIATEF